MSEGQTFFFFIYYYSNTWKIQTLTRKVKIFIVECINSQHILNIYYARQAISYEGQTCC